MEKVLADFHTHTAFSDSSRTPRELIEAMLSAHIQYAAITDHDSMCVFQEGVLERIAEELTLTFAAEQGRRAFSVGSLRLMSGIELSTCYLNQNQHLVGLGMRLITDIGDIQYLNQFAEQRNKRIEKLLQEIDERREACKGIYAVLGSRPLDVQEFYREVGAAVPTRLHIGRYLWEHYRFCENPREAMKLAVNRELTNYDFAGETMSIADAISLIHKYGGIAVVPHLRRQSFSGIVERGPVQLIDVLRDLKQQGIDGIEINPADELNSLYLDIARDLELLKLVGTDDHGINGPTYYGSSNQVQSRIEMGTIFVHAALRRLQLND